MHYNKADIEGLERFFRANLINTISGYKPANLIGTVSNQEQENLAIFNSVIHIGANPALLGFLLRPATVERHTYDNIHENGCYTINHVHHSFIEQAHFTSAKFAKDESEFAYCKLTPEYLADFKAPFVAESQIKIGMRYVQEIPIELNGTILIIGQIEHLILPNEILEADGNVDLSKVQDVCSAGLESYYEVQNRTKFAYARVKNLPDFV